MSAPMPEPDGMDADLSELIKSELLERRAKVMFLRNAGATWKAIAAECEVSEATARKDYQVVCRDLNNEQPANIVARHRAVIYDIQRANYAAMMRGNVKAATVILKALHREAVLLGLDAPTRILAGVSDVEFANEAARLIERIQALDPHTLKELERAHHTTANIIEGHVEPGPEAQPERSDPADLVADDAGQPGSDPGPDGEQGAAGSAGPADGDPDDDPDADWSNID